MKKQPTAGWWWNSTNQFSCLSVDLGQRDAGAFALLDVRANHDFGSKPAREIGKTDGKTWRAAVVETGLFRLPGEDAKVFVNGVEQVEHYGEKGRMADPWEWEEALEIAKALRPDLDAHGFVGGDVRQKTYPAQNDGLIRCLRLAMGRLARMQSLSWRLLEAERATEALGVMRDSEDLKKILLRLPGNTSAALVAGSVTREIFTFRETLKREIVRIANRVLPLRDRHWEWAKRADGQNSFILRQTPRGTVKNSRKIMGQRGLSMERINQLEELRKRALSLNRALQHEPGLKPILGRVARGIELPDACPEILEKLDNLKEQRINQTAHLILARALGLRLKSPQKSRTERAERDIHGEYESYRPPVGFIVLENLSRYLSSQGRAPSENSRLMQWCHRALLGKLRELCEPYGLVLVQANAAYSSRFCSRTGVAGFRAAELTPDSRNRWPWRKELERLEKHDLEGIKIEKERLAKLRQVKAFFKVLDAINIGRDGHSKPIRTLLAPQIGGPMFVPMTGCSMQADINAAINIGLRAIAAPDCHAIHVRIRSESKTGKFIVRSDTKREKSRWGKAKLEITMSSDTKHNELVLSRNPNFFVDMGGVARFDQATIEGVDFSIASGRGIFGTIKQSEWEVVNSLNFARLEKNWGMGYLMSEYGDDNVTF